MQVMYEAFYIIVTFNIHFKYAIYEYVEWQSTTLIIANQWLSVRAFR